MMFWRRLASTAAPRLILNHGPVGPPVAPMNIEPPTSMLQHIRKVQLKYKDAVVLAQVGSFMELYFDQALKYGPALNLKVATKSATSNVPGISTVYMSGFPLSQKEKYERLLVRDMGLKVVTLMQNSSAVLNGDSEEEKRPVTRIITPGTLLGESYVDEAVSNFLASVCMSSKDASLMWVDVANGEVFYENLKPAEIGNALARVAPSEVLLMKDRNLKYNEFLESMISQYAPKATITTVPSLKLSDWRTDKKHPLTFKIDNLSKTAQRAFMVLSDYIRNSLPNNPIDMQLPVEVPAGTVMQLDASARSSLDLMKEDGSGEKSLFSTIKRTQTPAGSRLLQDWLAAPLLNIGKIEERQNSIECFLNQNQIEIENLRGLLRELPDCPRTLQKLRSQTLDPRDLILFAKSILTIDKIREVLKYGVLDAPPNFVEPLQKQLPLILKFANKVLNSVKRVDLEYETPTSDSENTETEELSQPTPKRTKGSSRGRKGPLATSTAKVSPASHREYSPVLLKEAFSELKEIYNERDSFSNREDAIRKRLQEKYGPSAELRWTPMYDHHVKCNAHVAVEPPKELILNRSRTSISFIDTEWKRLGADVLESSSRLRKIEEKILNDMRNEIIENYLHPARIVYKTCTELDVILSMAQLAKEQQLVKPKIVEDPGIFDIKGGRHITIEMGLSIDGLPTNGFVPNDCNLSRPQPVCMITGPNMGGKSTYLRQNAIIALLAQVGSYVPCDEATIGIVDRIYCRIGAGDDLYRGRSTFMVEMLEAAEILNTATEKSLAIVDEVGRGTSNNDGVAIAFAAIKHLALRNKSRVLFATHYGTEIKHLLETESEGELTKVIRLLKSDLSFNSEGELVFKYALKEGIASSSRGLLIAKLAGFPPEALKDAIQIAENHTYV